MSILATSSIAAYRPKNFDALVLRERGSAQGKVGLILKEVYEQTRAKWLGHSAYLTRRPEPDGNLPDSSVEYVTFPVVKTVEATFEFVGNLLPMPVPDLDD